MSSSGNARKNFFSRHKHIHKIHQYLKFLANLGKLRDTLKKLEIVKKKNKIFWSNTLRMDKQTKTKQKSRSNFDREKVFRYNKYPTISKIYLYFVSCEIDRIEIVLGFNLVCLRQTNWRFIWGLRLEIGAFPGAFSR